MSISGQLKEGDYVAAQFLHMRPRRVYAIIGVLLSCLAILAVVYSHSLILILCLAYLAGCFFIYLPFRAKRTFRQYKALSERMTVEIRDDGLFVRRINGEGLVPWSQIMKWRNNRKLVLLYPAGSVFHLIPSHFFPNENDFKSFLDTLESRLGKAK